MYISDLIIKLQQFESDFGDLQIVDSNYQDFDECWVEDMKVVLD